MKIADNWNFEFGPKPLKLKKLRSEILKIKRKSRFVKLPAFFFTDTIKPINTHVFSL